ncbi:MAG: SLC13 family permease [Flavobacteriales bacterium]
MTIPAIIVTLTVLLLIVLLYFDVVKAVMAFFIVILILLFSGVIATPDVMSGFANEQIAVVILLLILSDIIQRSGALDTLLSGIFNPALSYKRFMLRLTGSVASVSGFVNNTPLVAILIPHTYEWARKKGISPSKVLLPLSYAALLGGTITLVGTSTNLIVNGFLQETGHPGFGFFDFTIVGLPVALLGVGYIILLGLRLLPDRRDALANFKDQSREYLVETKIPTNSGYIGKSVEEAGLRNLKGLFLVEIQRGEERIIPVGPKEIIEDDDALIFAGDTSTIIDLLGKNSDMILPKYSQLGQENIQVVEVVISAQSSLIGKRVRNTNFRGNYDAAIVAINRDGSRLTGKIGEVILVAGDLLLLTTGKDFTIRAEEQQDFFVISQLKQIQRLQPWKGALLFGGLVAVFTSAAIGFTSLFEGLLLLLGILAAARMIRFTDLKKSFDLELYLILVFALALGKSMSNSGLDELIASGMLSVIKPLNSPVAALAAVYLLTNVLAMLVSNKAAVAIAFPVTIAACQSMGVENVTPFVLAIAFAGSAEFMTPYGYQTNLMVYGPGGYKFKDYVKVGWGLSLLYMVMCIAILSWVYGL